MVTLKLILLWLLIAFIGGVVDRIWMTWRSK